MSNFDWHTEEDTGWEPEPRPAAPPRRRSWRWLLLALPLLLLAAAGGFWLYRDVDEQVAVVDAAVRADVLAAHALIERANALRDVELIRANLSARDPAWMAAQKQQIAAGQLWDLSSIGLPRDLAASVAAPEVALSPSLKAAAVTFETAYAAGGGVVRLRQTAVYRQGTNGRWLYAPPLPSFWGEPVTVAAEGLRLVAPQRDAAFAEALAEALARTRAAVCRALAEADCDARRPLAVELSRSPASLEVLTDPALLLTQALTLTLPAPSLLGMPQDEAGRHALLRGYAARLALVEIARAVDYECCEQGRFFRALVDAQLDRLGLQPWPLTAADYETLLMEDVRLSHMPAVWLDRSLAYDQDDWRWAHALVAYLTQAADADSPAALLRGLGGSFVTWLQRATREEVPPSTAWPAFVYAQSRSGQLDAPPLPLPADRLQALCSGLSRELTGLYEYDFAASRWGLKMIAGDGYWRSLLLVPLPRPDSYLAQVSTTGAAQTRLQLWRPDEQFVIHEMPDNAARTVAYPLGHDPSGRYTVIGYWSSPRGLDSFGLLDVENCEADACVLRDLPGRPYWSFDGTRTLLLEGAGRPVQVSVGDSQANNQTALGMAQTAFWLDDETIGLLQQADDGTQWIEVVGVAGGTPRTWLTAEALNAVLPAADAASRIRILTAVPATATQLLLVGTPLPDEVAMTGAGVVVFLVRHGGGAPGGGAPGGAAPAIEPIFTGSSLDDMRISPDGRWAAVGGRLAAVGARAGQAVIHLVDLASGAQQTLPQGKAFFWNSGWSPDSSWFGVVYSNYALLTAPAFDYRYLVPLDVAGCEQQFWSVAP